MDVDENSVSDTLVLSRMSVNTRLGAAHIFEEESNDSVPEMESEKRSGKIKSSRNNVKKSPYKTNIPKKNIEYETDPAILDRRQKQIDYGKNTMGYDHYRSSVPINKRKKDHPRTPIKYLKYSRRGWDSLVRIWRTKLHEFDPKDPEEESNSSISPKKGQEQAVIESDAEDNDDIEEDSSDLNNFI